MNIRKRGPARVVGVALITLLAVSAGPARALPSSQTTIVLDVNPATDYYSRQLTAYAGTANGTIVKIELCTSSIESCARKDFDNTLGPSQVQRCVSGDYEQHSALVHFPGPGTYQVVARATSAGCPVVGTQSEISVTQDVVIEEPPPPPPPPLPIECADDGAPAATDVGVTDTAVALGSTVIQSGPLSAFMSDAVAGMRAAAYDINRSGGVCGRTLSLNLQDDGGNAQLARQDVGQMSHDDFAFVAMPDPPGLEAASSSGDIDALGVPVVGTVGSSSAEFSDPSIWSVGGSPSVFASAVVAHAYDAGARRFGLVTNGNLAWLAAARDAAIAAIQDHDGTTIASDVVVDPGATSFASDIATFGDGCASSCDAVIYLLDPVSLLRWMSGAPQRGSVENDLPPFDLSLQVATNCQSACDGMTAWDPYVLPIGPHADSQYLDAIRSTDPSADPYNPMVEGAYVGTYLAARAIAAAGSNLTRARLQRILDTQSFSDPLVGSAFAWGPQRAPNRCVGGYQIQYKGTFGGWRTSTGWLCN